MGAFEGVGNPVPGLGAGGLTGSSGCPNDISQSVPDLSPGMKIKRGRPFAPVDQLGSILAIPLKFIMLNRKVGNRDISPQAEAEITAFSQKYAIPGVTVRLCQYAPWDELQCLLRHKRFSSLIRGTLGVLHLVGYTVLPWRIVGGDCYNPMSNSVHIFSNIKAFVLHELGHAHDYTNRKYPGIYSLMRLLPFFALYQEYQASKYAIRYLRANNDKAGEREAFRVLIPAYATYLLGALVPQNVQLVFLFPFVVVGHVVGGILASRVQG